MGELEFLVYVSGVLHWPVLLTLLVDACSVRPKFSTGLDFVEQEAVGREPARMLLVDEVVGQLPTTDLLTHDEAPVSEVGLVQLDNGFEDVVFLW